MNTPGTTLPAAEPKQATKSTLPIDQAKPMTSPKSTGSVALNPTGQPTTVVSAKDSTATNLEEKAPKDEKAQKKGTEGKTAIDNYLKEQQEIRNTDKEEVITPLDKYGPLFKYIALPLFILNVFSLLWFSIDLDQDNRVLSKFGIENLAVRYEEAFTRFSTLEGENNSLTFEIKKTTDKIENEQYTNFQDQIVEIKSEQLIWFDRKEDGKTLMGMLDAFQRMADFFNDRGYSDPQKIVTGRKEQILIQEYSVNRSSASVSIKASQVLGRVFFLTNEFIDLVNSFPFYQNAEIRNFTREKNDYGDDSMEFSITLDRQLNPDNDSQNTHIEVDPADSRFSEYLQWQESKK